MGQKVETASYWHEKSYNSELGSFIALFQNAPLLYVSRVLLKVALVFSSGCCGTCLCTVLLITIRVSVYWRKST